jgi:hypothetical protein
MEQNFTSISEWLAAQAESIPAVQDGLTSEERKQLQAVNRSIQQLTSSGIAVPDELRRIKLDLSAKDQANGNEGEIESRLEAIEKVIQSLAALTKEARGVRDKLKSSNPGGGTKKHYGVSLLELLQSGYLSTDDKLELQWKKTGPTYEGKLLDDGSVSAKTDAGWRQFDSLSTAAATIGGRALNGWKHWCRVNRDGSLVTLKEIRSRYMKERGIS